MLMTLDDSRGGGGEAEHFIEDSCEAIFRELVGGGRNGKGRTHY